MSVEVISWALNEAPVTSTIDAMVLVGLANHAGKDGTAAFPSLTTLARYARCDERTVRRSIRRMQQQGLLRECDQRIVEHHVPRADRRPTGYDIVMDGGAQCPPVEFAGGHTVTNGGAHCHERGGSVPPEPSSKPSEEPLTSDSGEPEVSDNVRELVRLFASGVKANGHSVPGRGTKANRDWLREMDRLLRRGPPGEGGYVPSEDEVRRVIKWCVTDYGDDRYPGEATNVRSVVKFRKRYSELRLKALAATNGKASAMAYNDPRRAGGIV